MRNRTVKIATLLAVMIMTPGFHENYAARAEALCTGAEDCRDRLIAKIGASRYNTNKGGFLPQAYTVGSGMVA